MTSVQCTIIEHALGDKSHYRNYYVVNPKSPHHRQVEELVEAGLMRRGRAVSGQLQAYHVTEAGQAQAFQTNPR